MPSDAEPKACRTHHPAPPRAVARTYTLRIFPRRSWPNFFAPSPAQAQLSAAGEAHEARRQAAPKQTAHDKLPFRLIMEDSPGQMWSPNGFVNVVKHPKQRRPRPVDDDDYM